MAKFGQRMEGRRTYLLSGAVIGVVLILVFVGRLTPETGMTIALVALGLFAASFRAALQQHHDETLKVLVDVAALGKAAATRNVGMVIAVGTQTVQDGCVLDQEIEGEVKS